MSSMCTTKPAVLRRRIRQRTSSTTRLYAAAMALAMTKYLHRSNKPCISTSARHTTKSNTDDSIGRNMHGMAMACQAGLNSEFLQSEAYTNAGVSLNLAVKVCVSGLVPTMATTAV